MEIGTIVTVCQRESYFYDAQGQVVGHIPETDEVLVKFGPKDEDLVSNLFSAEEEKQIRFQKSALKKDDDWLPVNKADMLFGKSMWHSVRSYKKPFVPGQDCKHVACKELATKRILVNSSGIVIEYDVCDKHATQYHGKFMDQFPKE